MEIALIYPHQLFLPHPALFERRPVFLVEEPLFFGTDNHWPLQIHKQKLVLHIASMAAYAEELRREGHEVEILHLPRGSSRSDEVLKCGLPRSVDVIHLADVVDDLLERRIRRFADEEGMQLVVADSPNFLSPRDFVEEHTGPQRKKPFMARFYEAQRKRMDILVDPDGEPVGGRWSFDEENRKKWPKGATPPQEPCVEGNSFVEEAISRVEDEFADRPSETQGFRWPVKRRDAEHWLKQFFEERFHDFGPYEDAIFTGHAFLHHSAMTPMLNIGLLNPADLIEATLKAGSSHGIGMASQEGFIRQVIG